MKKFICLSCHKEKAVTLKSGADQSFCGDPLCQRARKATWKRKKLASDIEYRSTQSLSNKKWQQDHPNYWREYRIKNPDVVKQNLLLQKNRNLKRKKIRS